MAALSYYSSKYSNWEAFQQLDSEMNILAASPLPQDLLLSFPNEWNNIDSIFEPNNNDLFHPDSFLNEQTIITENRPNSLQHNFSSTELNSVTPELPFPLQQEVFDPNFHYPKRQKYEDVIYSDYNNGYFFNEPVFPIPNPCLNFQGYESTVIMPTLPDFPNGPPVYNPGSSCESTVVKKETTAAGSLSAQSIAARQRRRKITEKTQELGKLIPGGQKMNTAEMLQAAYKYIKYMQAQVGVLEFMGSYNQEKEETYESDELHGLLESPLIQEKLYSTEKCMVPKKFVQEISNDCQIVESNPELIRVLKEEH